MEEVGSLALLAILAVAWIILLYDYYKFVKKCEEEERKLNNNESKKEEL